MRFINKIKQHYVKAAANDLGSIKGVDASGKMTEYKTGDKVWRVPYANVPGGWDTVKMCFMAEHLLMPYAPNEKEPAVVLMGVSWAPLTGISKNKLGA